MKIIGMSTNAESAEVGNGASLQKACVKHEMAPMNTWESNPAQRTNYPAETITRISPDGNREAK